jgi:polysaccharide biosynthesis protein PelA
LKKWLALLMCWWAWQPAVSANATSTADSPSVAFFYGANPPWDELQAFDLVVVDPDHVPNPTSTGLKHTRLAAYVALGEVQPSKPYAKQIPVAWFRGENKDWGSRLIDQSQADWPAFFRDQVIGPLWSQGYRTVFLDTLDSYQLFSKTPQSRAVQEAGMVAVLKAVKQRYPELKLVFNRGFEILDRTHALAEAVVAESLFQGYDAGKAQYKEVNEQDRAWLLGQLNRAKNEFNLSVIAIDYVPTAKRTLARETARKIAALGFTPWVSTPDLGSIGVGSLEVIPRKVLVVHSPIRDEYQLRSLDVVRLASMPLNYLGYVPEYVDPDHLPAFALKGRYAGILIWLNGALDTTKTLGLAQWVGRQIEDTVPVSVVNQTDLLFDGKLSQSLGLNANFPATDLSRIEIAQQDASMGFERAPRPQPDSFFSLTLQTGKPLLTLKRGATTQVAAAITPWGGYVMDPYAIVTLPGNAGDRWVVDPFLYLTQSLQLTPMPVPDVTTASGRRMLMVHMDGDGFVSRSELPGNPLAGEVLRDRVVNKYPVPMTISVIEAELSPQGLYPELSSRAEGVARTIFKAPNVALASHSYTHPFNWRKAGQGTSNPNSEGDYHLPVPGYEFNLEREIKGSIDYINTRLAPPGKKVDLFFWTGNCVPGNDALAWTQKMGVFNMNGGDTVATRSDPSLTKVEGLGVPLPGGFQVFAPNQNENVYTNLWRGPFYGFERVIETFEITESPRRLKPMDIYFHTYITTKLAGMQSLDNVFGYALSKETTPVYVADYARMVLDFQRMVVARTADGWLVRGGPDLRTLRVPNSFGVPDVGRSQSVAGYRIGASDTYIHSSGDNVRLILAPKSDGKPWLVSANARVNSFSATPNGFQWDLAGQVPLKFTLANVGTCQIRQGSQVLSPSSRSANLSHYELKDHAARSLQALCRN